MITFAQIKISPINSNIDPLITIVDGHPKTYNDISSRIIVDEYIKSFPPNTEFIVDCKILGYGAGEKCQATFQEITCLLNRQIRDPDYIEKRCKTLNEYCFNFKT